MQLTVKGYRGIDRAEITIPEGQITLLAANNAQGKTSLVEALIHNISTNLKPFGLSQKDIQYIVHDGAKTAEATLETAHGSRRISWPACEVHTLRGQGLHASDFALGTKKFTALTPEQRSATLIDYLAVELDRKRVEQELSEIEEGGHKLPGSMITSLCDTIFGTEKLSAKGFDAAAKVAEDAAKTAKTTFANKTGVKWGSNQGLTFRPQGWDSDLEKLDSAWLAKDITEARENLERAIAENAIGEVEYERLKGLAEGVTDLEFQLSERNAHVESLRNKCREAADKLKAQQASEQLIACEGCGLLGHVKGRKLVADDGEFVQKDPKVQEESDRLAKVLHESQIEAGKLEEQLKQAKQAENKLKTAKTGDETQVQNCRGILQRAEERKRAFEIKQEGTKVHYQVLTNLAAAELLSPEGLRKRELVKALEGFNKSLAQWCDAAGWKVVSIESDMTVRYAGKPYLLISGSEQYKVNATFAVVFAHIENAPIVLFDKADELERLGRNQLLKLLKRAGRTAVIAATFFADKGGNLDVPDLEAAKLGRTYWIVDGKVVELPTLAAAK